jgi:glycosyltransferase involved in cell wall biosynthesis
MRNHGVKVSIFIQTFNHELFISECIDSVLNQAGSHNFEIIVVDDASKDNTVSIIKKYKNERIVLIENRINLGCIATANIGYSEARGEYSARLDGDDRYRPDFLSNVIPILDENPNVGLVYADIAMVDSLGKITAQEGCIARQREGRPNICNELIPLMKSNFLPAPTTIGRTKFWQSILPIPSSLHFLDYYMTLQAAHSFEFGFVNKVLADYRIHSGNQHSKMVIDGTGERSTFEMLNRAFDRIEFKNEKVKARRIIEATHFLDYAEKYFGAGMCKDARRCYWQFFKRNPVGLTNPGLLRRSLAALVGIRFYEKIKNVLKNI